MTKHLRRLPPADVALAFWRKFGELDPFMCERVARHVDLEQRRLRVDLALLAIGKNEGFCLTKGFRILVAGRWIVKHKEKQERAAARRGTARSNSGVTAKLKRRKR